MAQAETGRLLASTRAKFALCVASALVLVAGTALAPRSAPRAVSVPEERPAQLVREQAQARTLAQPFRGTEELAARLHGHSVAVLGPTRRPSPARLDFTRPVRPEPPAGFGVFVTPERVVTHAAALAGRSVAPLALSDGRVVEARLVAHEPYTGLVLMQLAATGTPPSERAGEPPAPGAPVVAVGTWDGREVAAPVFVTRRRGDRYTLAGASAQLLPGMPVYDAEGALFAIAAGGTLTGEAFASREAADRLAARAAAGGVPGALGLALQDASGALASVLGGEGPLVADVVEGGPAERAGVQPGDLLLAVGEVEGGTAESVSAAVAAASPGQPLRLRLRRGGRVLSLDATPAPDHAVAALAEGAPARAPSGPRADDVFASEQLSQAGVPAAARLRAVRGRSVASRGEALRELGARAGPALVWLEGEEGPFFAALERPR